MDDPPAAEPVADVDYTDSPTVQVRVAVAHEDDLFRDILVQAFTERRLIVVGDCRTSDELLAACAAAAPDVIVLSDRLGVDIEQTISALLDLHMRVIVVSGDPAPERLSHLLSLGVHGYMLYDTSPAEVAIGVQAVGRGAVAVNHTVAAILVQQWRRLREKEKSSEVGQVRALTPREQEVLNAMVEGLPTKAIARRLQVAFKTVENHKIRIFGKLGVRTHAQAVSVAIRHGLVPPVELTPASGSDDPRG